MLQSIVIGNVGADAQVKNKDGREFTTFRVAHNEQWAGQDGVQHSTTIWVDCIMNGHPKVTEFLKAGTQVVCIGRSTLRVYSSEKDRCMKAGLTIHVQSVQLIGGKTEDVPREVINPDTGDVFGVDKVYHVEDWDTIQMLEDSKRMVDERGRDYIMDKLGFIKPLSNTAKE